MTSVVWFACLGAAAWAAASPVDAVESSVAVKEAATSVNLSASDWPQWRGPQRNGHLEQAAPWPDALDSGRLKLLWRVPLGPSYSGPIVVGPRVFVTETRDRKNEVASALDRATGKQLWETSWAGAMSVPFFAKENGDWIRSTPACDGDALYVAGMRDVLHCLDAQTGARRWQIDFVERYKTPLPAFGYVSSPLVEGTDLYVQAGASCFKLDKLTGKEIWRTLQDGGGMFGSAFSSPCLAVLAGRRQLLVQTREKLAGVDPATGSVFWDQVIPTFRGMNILTPTVQGDTVFTSAYNGKSHLFRISPADETQQPKLSEIWTNKVRGYMSSPVVVDNHVYLHLQNQRFSCIDLSTGETKWTTAPFGKYWSMVVNGNKILALDEQGKLLLIRANPERFELLDSREISDEPTWAYLAVSGNELFVRELNALAAYRWSD